LGKKLTSVVVSLSLLACAPQPQRSATPVAIPSPIDTVAIRGHTRFLSDDALRGRGTGTREADIAALYIESACAAIGFGPIANKRYQQPVSLRRTSIAAAGTSLTLTGPRGERSFEYRTGFLPNLGFDEAPGFTGPAIFVGTSENIQTGQLRALNLRGAVAVILGPLLDAADDTLWERGAAGLVQLTADESQYLLYVRSRGDSRLRLDDSAARSLETSMISVVASPRLSREITTGVPLAQGPRPLADSITLRVDVEHAAVSSSNVGCLLEGGDPKAKDTAIAFTAHYDHLGVGMPDAHGDSIYNGFSDNAAGVAMLLALGQAFAERPIRPRHSIQLLFFTGEEQGLLGSDYYVAHPLWPLEKTRAVINLDAGAPPARPWSWRIAGKNTALSQLAQDVAASRGWTATTSAATPNSDYYPFARLNIPAIFIVPGSAPYQGLSADSSQALRRRWDRYHEPADEWAADFPFAGLGRYAEYAYLIGRALDGPQNGRGRQAPLPACPHGLRLSQ
jgi:hypothetical protein